MGLITGKGKEVTEQVNQKKVDLKEAFIRLKDENESVTVRVLAIEDFVSYKAHGDFKKGIYNSPCLAVDGQDCPFCTAKSKGGEDWDGFYAKDRVMFALGVIDAGVLKVLEVSKNQAKGIIADILEYKEEIIDGEIAFNLTRTGTGTSTGYSLKALTAKKFVAIKDKFEAFDGQVVELEFFEDRISAKTPDYMVKLLHEAGFPIEEHFSAELCAKALAETTESTVETVKEENSADVI